MADSKTENIPESAQKGAPQSGGNAGSLTSPEGILMLCVAGVIDIASIVPILNFASWIVGIIFIGGWYAFFHTKQAVKAGAKRIIFKIIVVLFCEVVPIVSVAPTWTWFVYKVLKDG